ncbi:MAG TPA: protein meaA [Deltaproteobacteria bacterium]|nr:protein meaA [Candidatus Binatota bacterium]HIL14179.1 protein meaA [Deltaproteobacteria bacterium]
MASTDKAASKQVEKDRPWIFRTYSGHSSAEASNALYRGNLEKGQTGLSVAFDLPTQTGYDSDHPLARGEVGKVGVPVDSIADMETLFNDIPLDRMNTSMTINATAAWLLALYVAVAERQGVDPGGLQGTIQNDIIKEYLSRGTYVFPPTESMRLTGDIIEYTVSNIPKWNPINICSYHLQEAGATPSEELAFTLANAIAVLDEVKKRPGMDSETMVRVFGRISFFVNASIRFIEETCKMRAFVETWDKLGRERYGVEDPKLRRFRYGVQVNSLGLTEQQPENNAIRIALEMLGVVLSKKARARAVQLPAWNEALGLPRPWDQQWALRTQQIMAYETDLLEYADILDESPVVQAKVDSLIAEAYEELERIDEMAGAVEAVEAGYMKQRLVDSNARRLRRIEAGEQCVVGVNRWAESEPSPLTSDMDNAILKVDVSAEREQIERLEAFRAKRNKDDIAPALQALRDSATSGSNIMESSIAAASAGLTTGEWSQVLRDVFGEYRAPTGVGGQSAADSDAVVAVREKVKALGERLGHTLRLLVGKPGLDGHSNGAEQIAVRARDCGMEVIYHGIRLTSDEIVATAQEEDVDAIGLSILSGSHMTLVPDLVDKMKKLELEDVTLVVGGIIPDADADQLKALGVAGVYTPRDFELTSIMNDIVELVSNKRG